MNHEHHSFYFHALVVLGEKPTIAHVSVLLCPELSKVDRKRSTFRLAIFLQDVIKEPFRNVIN